MLFWKRAAISSTRPTSTPTAPVSHSSANSSQGHREKLVLATKYTLSPPVNDPNAAGNQRKNMVQAVEASLKRLQTDYIDLYWLHIWDQLTPIEEVMRAFDDLVRQGKILYAGVSDMPAWVVAKGNTLAELRGWTPFIGLQIEYSLIERTPERELLPMASSLGLGITAWSPLAGGVLTGKYADPKPGDAGKKRFDIAEMAEFHASGSVPTTIAREVQAVARECGRSPAQVALAWLRHRPDAGHSHHRGEEAGAIEGQFGQHRGETRPAASRPLGGGQPGGIGIPSRLLQEGHGPHDCLRRHA